MAQSKVSIPNVNTDGRRPLVGKNIKVSTVDIKKDIAALIEAIGSGSLDERQHAHLRSFIYAHYHPELKIGPRVFIYQAVKDVLEDGNLNQLKDIAGIREKSAYINALSNVGKRSSYFGGLIGVTVAGYFFLPPIVKFGVIPAARGAIKKLVPKTSHLIPIDKTLKISSLVEKSPDVIYSGIRQALGSAVRKSGKPVAQEIDTTPMDDLVGNLFFRALIEQSSFSPQVKNDFRKRSQIAFLCDMAKVGRQLEGLVLTPLRCWERVSNYTNFAMFLKSMESKEVPIQNMLHSAVETISRAKIGQNRKDHRFYTEFERGLKNMNYVLQVVDPLDKFNERDAFDDIESQEAKLAFFTQNRLVMERLYYGHDRELERLKPMFLDFQKAALEPVPKRAKTEDARYKVFQSRIKGIIASNKKAFAELGKSELKSYNQELNRLS